MDRQAFKQRMQNLKSYRENNPGKGYWDWRNSLPDNLKYTDDTEYDMQAAYEAGVDAEYVEEDRTYHLPTRDPKTGYIFKKSIHPTFWKGLAEDAKLGYDAYFLGDKVYTKSKGEGPIKAFADGGQTGDPEKERFYQATGRSSSGRPLEEGLKPVFSLEDAANMTPIGDAISAKDAYNAVKNRDWLGAGLAAATMIPFVPMSVKSYRKKYKGVTPKREIPTVNKDARNDAINEAIKYKENRIKLYEQALEDRNLEYENWIENEDALRRAVNFDKKYGTNYVNTYTKELRNYAKGKNSNDLTQVGIKPMTADGSFDPAIPNYIFISSDQIGAARPKSGLINHELGHRIDRQAGVIGPQGQLNIPIFDRSKFESTERLKQIYPKTYDRIQNYLLKDSEIKSHMNAFRTYLRDNNMLGPNGKETLDSFKKKLFNSDFDDLKKIFNSYKSGKQFIQDFNMIPITKVNNNNNTLV